VEEILGFIIQLVIEVLVQIFGALGLDVASSRRGRGEEGGCGWLAVFAFFGGVCGGLSLIPYPAPLLPNAGLRIANLIVAPLLAGGVSALAANLWAGRGWNPAHHFWRGFWFAMLFGLVRFAYVTHQAGVAG
jgi:hypothetical protein